MRSRNVLSGLALGLPLVQSAVPSILGFTLTWSDDFTGDAGSTPDPSNWIIDTGTGYPGGPTNWGTGEIQTYTSDTKNLHLSGNGSLEIVAIRDANGGWTSARIETQRSDFVCSEGGKMRIVASLNLPSVDQPVGYWPAFWTVGSAYRGNYTNWPAIGEWDILESVNGVNKLWGTLHCGVDPGGPCDETNGLGGSAACPGTPCEGNFHTYTFEVDRTQEELEAIRWYVDGVLYWQVTSADIPAATWAEAVHDPHFVLLNLAIGGSFPNNVYGSATPLATTTSGGVFEVEYVAVYNT